MNEFQAAMGLCNLRHIDEVMAKRKRIRELYDAALKGIPGIRVLEYQPGVHPNHSYYPIVFTDTINRRDEMEAVLAAKGVLTRKYFYPLVTDYDWMENRFASRRTPVAQQIANRVLTLPLYPDLTPTDVTRICDILRERMMTR
jgi:dTDP-4-amino-4,6-dideoxygalactose transaminase